MKLFFRNFIDINFFWCLVWNKPKKVENHSYELKENRKWEVSQAVKSHFANFCDHCIAKLYIFVAAALDRVSRKRNQKVFLHEFHWFLFPRMWRGEYNGDMYFIGRQRFVAEQECRLWNAENYLDYDSNNLTKLWLNNGK